MFTREIDAYIDVIKNGKLSDLQVQDLQEAGFKAVESSNLNQAEKIEAMKALGFDTRPTKSVCLLHRRTSKRLRVFLEHGIDIGSQFNFVESIQNEKNGASYAG